MGCLFDVLSRNVRHRNEGRCFNDGFVAPPQKILPEARAHGVEQGQHRDEHGRDDQGEHPPLPLLLSVGSRQRQRAGGGFLEGSGSPFARGLRNGLSHETQRGHCWPQTLPYPIQIVYEADSVWVTLLGIFGEQPYRYSVHPLRDRGVYLLRRAYVPVDVLHRYTYGILHVVGRLAGEHLVEDSPQRIEVAAGADR